jgi:hypothetical protein
LVSKPEGSIPQILVTMSAVLHDSEPVPLAFRPRNMSSKMYIDIEELYIFHWLLIVLIHGLVKSVVPKLFRATINSSTVPHALPCKQILQNSGLHKILRKIIIKSYTIFSN